MKRRVFLRGELDHAAITRVPVNPRTEFTQATEKSMAKITRKEDALSIVGDGYLEDVEELDEKDRVRKADVDDLVTKADQEAYDEHQEQELILRALLQDEGLDDEAIEKAQWDYAYKKALPNSAYAWVETGEGCEKADGKTPQRCRHLPYKSKSGSVDCSHTRAALQAIGGARSGKKMSVPSTVKQKLRRALKSCQSEKAEFLDTELTEYEQGRVDGYNAALDLDIPDDEETTMAEQETKAEELEAPAAEAPPETQVNLDAILAAVKPLDESKEEKAEVPRDEFDEHADLLRQIISAEGSGREKKWQVAEAVLRSLAAHMSQKIAETTPVSPEDVASSVKSQVVEAIQPMMDRLAVVESLIEGKKPESPQSKALHLDISGPAPSVQKSESEGFMISPYDTIRKAQGAHGPEKSLIKKYARQGMGLEDDTVL